jgi:NADPH:quinone reductase-like Zn-dependent oxidoreductase
MRSIAICGNNIWEKQPQNPSLATIDMDGVSVTCGCIESQDISFDREAPALAQHVLLKIRAFSCNYRDKYLIFRMATRPDSRYAYYVVGSEFVAEVLDVGTEVTGLQVGDRVMVNGSYPYADVPGVPGGLPTNNASKEYQILHYTKVLAIPSTMPDEVAAAFSIGGQTIYSMLRKLQIRPGAQVLITAAKSNTSLFAINALKKYGVSIYATSTSRRFESELRQLGVKELILIDPEQQSFLENDTIRRFVTDHGGFDYVIDPFYDLHIGKVTDVMTYGGKYITCGLYNQYLEIIGKKFQYKGSEFSNIMANIMLKNLHIIGNCIGVSDDLRQAIADYTAGILPVVLDAVYSDNQVGDFFHRTYNAQERFGKVVYRYSQRG